MIGSAPSTINPKDHDYSRPIFAIAISDSSSRTNTISSARRPGTLYEIEPPPPISDLPITIECHMTKRSTPMAVIVIVGTPTASISLATGGIVIMPSANGRRVVLG